MIDWLRIAGFFLHAKGALRRLYEAIARSHPSISVEELMRYDGSYVEVVRDMLTNVQVTLGDVMRELRLAGREDDAQELSRLVERLNLFLRDELRVLRLPIPTEKRKYSKRVLDYVGLAAVCECHRIYERAEELAGASEGKSILSKALRDMMISMERVRTLRNTLRWALSLESPQDFLEALRAEALKRAGDPEAQGPGISGIALRVAEAFVLADYIRSRRGIHERIAPDVLAAIRALSPTGKPFVGLDEIYIDLHTRRPGLSLKELKKFIDYLRGEGIIPGVIRVDKRDMVVRPEGLEPEIGEIVRLVRCSERFKRDGFSVPELMAETMWSREVIERALADMERVKTREGAPLVWRRTTPEGVKWYIAEFYEGGKRPAK